ncbi:hypothetical protein CLV91_0596 [Maribacter vaceletii]|uniref:Uncharacterized protein n=1 Tax=Maribacter vaceletii TaxID=1206816 RepID=A0A495ED23_9FLAO|nr:hypothetical protein [Maribacter vaceletii]RKR14519.1 hypothetical protein CLV91_0596 [Maribacter vaceletii]
MKKIALVAFLLITGATQAQKLKEIDGNPKDLKGIKEYALEFDYSDLEIPKYDSEEDFLADKMKKREEKEAGLGEKFKASWFSDREEFYEPKFIESFNKRFDDGELSVSSDNAEAEYTMKVHSNKIYAGYNVGIVRKNAEIDVTFSVYETSNPGNVLFSGKFYDVQGYGAMGNDYNSGYRISECYAKAAKSFAAYLKKKALK